MGRVIAQLSTSSAVFQWEGEVVGQRGISHSFIKLKIIIFAKRKLQNMTDKQREQRIKLLKDQLTIAVLFEKEFKEKLGVKGYQAFIDSRLDEINFLNSKKDRL